MGYKFLAAAAFLSLTGGCSCFQNWGADRTYWDWDASETEVIEVQQPGRAVAPVPVIPVVPAAPNQTPAILPPVNSSLPPVDNEFVNFQQTNANFREFGERTPRDQRIVTAAAGSNMSASIPPTIEEEVSDYEEEINAAQNNSGDEDNNSQMAGEDPVEDWLAEEGSSLKGLLTEWSERSGWRLIWNSNRNYKLSAGAMFRGRFADVSAALIRSFARAQPAPVATFYKGNRVLVVETMEDENAYN